MQLQLTIQTINLPLSSIISELGPYDPTTHFVSHDEGPFWLSPIQKIATKYDKTTDEVVTKNKMKVELLIELQKHGVETRNRLFEDLDNLSYIELFLFYIITGLGIALAFLANLIIKQFSASKFRLFDVIIGLLIYGSLFFINSKIAGYYTTKSTNRVTIICIFERC